MHSPETVEGLESSDLVLLMDNMLEFMTVDQAVVGSTPEWDLVRLVLDTMELPDRYASLEEFLQCSRAAVVIPNHVDDIN